MEMYQNYLSEKYDRRKVIFNESGFIEYETYPDNSVFIWALYIKPESRDKGSGRDLEIALIEKEKPNSISCSIDMGAKNVELSIRKILSVGYKISGYSDDHMVLYKDLTNGRDREREEKEV